MLSYTPGLRVVSLTTSCGPEQHAGAANASGVGRSASGSGTVGPPNSGDGMNWPPPGSSSTPPMTLIWLALTSPPPDSTAAVACSELTTIPPPLTSTPPLLVTARALSRFGSSRQRTQLLGAAGPAPAAAVTLMLLEARPRIGANAYCTLIGGVITWSAFDPSGQLSPGPGGGLGGLLGIVQQTISPLLTSPSSAHPAAAGMTWLLLRNVSTVSKAAAGPSSSSVDAPARAAESAAVCAEVRAAQFSPTSTTRAANASSSVRDSATVMATLPRSEPPRSRDIVGHRPRSGILSSSSRRSPHNPLRE